MNVGDIEDSGSGSDDAGDAQAIIYINDSPNPGLISTKEPFCVFEVSEEISLVSLLKRLYKHGHHAVQGKQ